MDNKEFAREFYIKYLGHSKKIVQMKHRIDEC